MPTLLEDAFTALLDQSTDLILVLDEAGTILAAGERARRVLADGVELRGRSFFDLVEPTSRARVRALLEGDPGRPELLELGQRRADGTLMLIQYASARFESPGGRPALVLSGRDLESHLILLEEMVSLNRDLEESRRTLERQALTDPLTGLGNRAWFGPALARLWASAAPSGQRIWVMMADLDRFKAINDTHGHEVGDAALRATAGALREALRRSDLVARLGGEEFALAGTLGPGDDAPPIAERILQAVREAAPRALPPLPARLTISLGLVLADPRGPATPDDALRAADRALYRAKAAGRDRFELTRLEPEAMPQPAGVA